MGAIWSIESGSYLRCLPRTPEQSGTWLQNRTLYLGMVRDSMRAGYDMEKVRDSILAEVEELESEGAGVSRPHVSSAVSRTEERDLLCW